MDSTSALAAPAPRASTLNMGVVAPGLPYISAALRDAILAGQFVDLTELPQAKGNVKPISGELEGKVLLLRPADLWQARKLILDIETWFQCFATVISRFPERATSLFSYAASIAKLSQKFLWPSCDSAYRQEAADTGNTNCRPNITCPVLSWHGYEAGGMVHSLSLLAPHQGQLPTANQ